MEEKKKKTIKLVALLVVAAAVIALLTFFIGEKIISFVSNTDALREWVADYGILSYVLFGLMVVVQVILAFIPGEPFEIAAGLVFGAFWGTVICVLAAFVGSVIVFLIVRKIGIKVVKLFFPEEKLEELSFLKSTKKKEYLFLLIYALPGTPKDLLSYFAGLTDIRFPVWILICSFGRIPSIITSTIGGNAIGEKNYIGAVIVFALTLLVSGAGLLIYNHICKKNKNERGKDDA